MTISGDRSSLEQQILSGSGLTGQALENLRARLATLSEQELQAELSKQISGENQGEWYDGIVLEHSDSVVQMSNYDKETYTDEDGNEVTEYKNGDEVCERIIKSTDEKGNIYETRISFSAGKPLSRTKSINGNKIETTTFEYNDNDGVSFVTIKTEKSDKSKTVTTVMDVDKNGNFDEESFIDRKTTLMDGTEIYVTKENGYITEEVTKFGQQKVTTVYNGNNIEDYDTGKLNRLKQTTTVNGEKKELYYDGESNTYVQVNAGETAQIMASRINKRKTEDQAPVSAEQIIELNPDLVRNNGEFRLQRFENGYKGLGEVRVPGEFDVNSPFIRTRQSIQEANMIAAQAEHKRQVAQKVVEGTDSKYAAELSNNGFKPSAENYVFYKKFNALNPSQQQNVLNIIKYCKSQNITDTNKIKAKILETFPEINLFDSGKVVQMNSSFGLSEFQKKNPVALETFLTDKLKLDLKSETGRLVYERLASLPQEELNKINPQNLTDLSDANFTEIAHRFEANGVDIRTHQEHQIENNSPRMIAEQEKRETRELAAQNIALAYDNAINVIRQYQDNQGWMNVGFYREKLGDLLSKINPTDINTCFGDVIKMLEEQKAFAVGYLQGKTTNDKEFREAFKKISGGAEYNEEKIKAFLEVAQDKNADFNDAKYNEKFWNAYDKAFGVAKKDKNGKVYYEHKAVKEATSRVNFQQYVDGAGDIVVMLLGTEAIGKGVAWVGGKAVSGVSRFVPKFVSKIGSKSLMTIGTNEVTIGRVAGAMASQSATFTLWDSGKNYINLRTKAAQYTGKEAEQEWQAYKDGNIESAKFGAAAGLLNSTIVGKVINGTMKMFEKPIAKAVSKVGTSFEKTSAMSGADVMKTFMMNQTPGMLAHTAGTLAEIAGFTLYETANEIAGELLKTDENGERHLPAELTEDGLASYLWERLKGQAANLGEIKAISKLLFMHKGAIREQARLMDENLAKCETLKNVKIQKTEVNGREIFEVTMPDGSRKVAHSVEEVIANCNVLMQLDMIQNSMKNEETTEWRKLNIGGEEVEVAVTKNADGTENIDFSKARKQNANGEYEPVALTTERDLLASEVTTKQEPMSRDEFLETVPVEPKNNLEQLFKTLADSKDLSVQDLKEYFKTTGNKELIELSETELNNMIKFTNQNNVNLLETLASRVGNGIEKYEINSILDMAKDSPEVSEKVNYLLSVQRDGQYIFNKFRTGEIIESGFDKDLLNTMLNAKKDGQYAYDKDYISQALILCGNNPQNVFAMNQIIESGKNINKWDLQDYVPFITPENVDLVFWVDKNFGYFGKDFFKYCKSTKDQLQKLEEIYQRNDLAESQKVVLAQGYLQAPEFSTELYKDPRYLESDYYTEPIIRSYAENKELIDYLISLKNPNNPEYTKYEPEEILNIINSGLKKSDITDEFLQQIDALKSLKELDGTPMIPNQVELMLFVKKNPELEPVWDIAYNEMTNPTKQSINGGRTLSLLKNFENIPKDYQERLLKLVHDKNNVFNLNHLWFVSILATKNDYITYKKKSAGDLFTDNPWKIRVFDDIISRVEKGELNNTEELYYIGELVENINSPKTIELYNKLMSLNTPENERFKLNNISDLLNQTSYFKMEDLDFILNYKDVDGVTPRFNGDEIDANLINWANESFRDQFENIAQLKNSDGSYKFDGIAIASILKTRSILKNSEIFDKLIALEVDGKAKFNGEDCKDLVELARSTGTNGHKLISDLMDSPDMTSELICEIANVERDNGTLPSYTVPWKELAEYGVLSDSEGLIDAKLIDNIKLFWDGDTRQAENQIKIAKYLYSQDALNYVQNIFIKGGLNQVDWAKKVIETAKKNNLSQQETRFLWQMGKQSIYDNYHGRWSELNTDKIDATNNFLNSLLKSDKEIKTEDFNTNEKLLLLNYLNEAKFEDFNSDLPFSKFIRSHKSIDELRSNIIKELEKELKLPGTEINITKQQVGSLLRGDFTNHLSDYPFIDNQSLSNYTYAAENAKNNANIDSRDSAVLKFATLLGGLSKDNQQCAIMARNLLEHNGLTSDITERVFNLIENRNWFDAYKQGKIDVEDIAVLFREPNDFELAKIISGKDFSAGENRELADNVETVLNKIYSTAPIVKPTKVPYEQSKFERVEFEGDEYKVVDFSNPDLDIGSLGFPKDLSKEQVRVLTHFIRTAQTDAINNNLSASSPELMNILCDEVNNTSLSTALVDPAHIDIDVMGRNCAVILEPMSSNYAAAYHEDFTSPLKKGYTEFKDYLTGKLTPEQRNYTSNVYKKHLNLSDSEYVQFYKALSKLDDTSRIKSDIVINKGEPNERTITAQEITESIEYVTNSLSNITKNWDELIIYNPKIKALLYKIDTPVENNVLENCPREILAFAKKYNLPIYIAKSSNYKNASNDKEIFEVTTKQEQMSRDEFLAYVDTLEFEPMGLDRKIKLTRFFKESGVNELADIYAKSPDIVMDIMKWGEKTLENGGFFDDEDVSILVNLHEKHGESVKKLLQYDTLMDSGRIKKILNSHDKDFILECLESPDTKIKALLKSTIDFLVPNTEFVRQLHVLDKNWDELVKDKDNETRINEVLNKITDAINSNEAIGVRNSLENLSKLWDLTLEETKQGSMDAVEAKKQLEETGVFNFSADKLVETYGKDGQVPQQIVDFAKKFFSEEKIIFGKEYERDIKDGYIDPKKYITAEKNRTYEQILKCMTDKSGNTNIEELNNIITFLTKDGNQIYVDDLFVYLNYGENSKGEVDLKTVQKIKSIIRPNSNAPISITDHDEIVHLYFSCKQADKTIDYESYNKLLDAVEHPWDIKNVNLILGLVGEDPEAKQAFINNPKPSIHSVQVLKDKMFISEYDQRYISTIDFPLTDVKTKLIEYLENSNSIIDQTDFISMLRTTQESDLKFIDAYFEKYKSIPIEWNFEYSLKKVKKLDEESQDLVINALKNGSFSLHNNFNGIKMSEYIELLTADKEIVKKLSELDITNIEWCNAYDFFNGREDNSYRKLSHEQREFTYRLLEICKNEGTILLDSDLNNLIANANPDTYEFIENYLKIQPSREKAYKAVLETVNNAYLKNENCIKEYEDFIRENSEFADKLSIDILESLDKFKIIAKNKELLKSLLETESDIPIDEILSSSFITEEAIEKSLQSLSMLTEEAKLKLPNALKMSFIFGLGDVSNKNYINLINTIAKYDADIASRMMAAAQFDDEISLKDSFNLSNFDYVADYIKNESTKGPVSDNFISSIMRLDYDIRDIENIINESDFPTFKYKEFVEVLKNDNIDNAISILKIYKELSDPDIAISFTEKNIDFDKIQELLSAVKANQNEITPKIFSNLVKVLNNENISDAISMLKNNTELQLRPEKIIAVLKNEDKITYKQMQHLFRLIGKEKFNGLSNTDFVIGCKFSSLFGKQNINEIPIDGKRDLLRNLVASNTGLFNISEDLSEEFPLLPKSQEEYCSLLPSIVRSLGIETNELTPEQRITMFNSSMGELSKSLADISDTDFAKMTVTQEYPKDQFIRDILDKVKDMSRTERQKVYDYFGFELHHNKNNETGFSITGYPVNLNNGKKLAQIDNPRTKEIVEQVRPLVIRFSQNNKIKCDNPKVEQFLNEVVDALPELRTAIGRKQHGSQDFDVMQHSLKVMQKITQDPKFSTLNESDQKIMLLASLMHDITKSEGRIDKTHANEGSFDTYFIAQKFNLTKEEEVKLHTLIKNHEWLEYANTAKSEDQLTKRLQSVAYDLHQGNLFDMVEIFTHADLRAVRKDDSFHDTTEGQSRIGFDGTVRSFGQSADIYAQRIRGYVDELKQSQPLLPQTKVPRASKINEAITQVNPDGSTNIKGVYKDKDGLVIIKFNEVEDWETIGFPKGSVSHGIEIAKGTRGDAELSEDVNTGNIKFFVHGLEYSNQLAKFDAFSLVDSDALLSVSYAERPESKFRFFRAQGVILDVNSKYIHGGGNTDSGSGCGKNINEFKNHYIFGGARQSDRTYVSDLIKKTTGMSDAEYIKFVEANKDKSLAEIEPVELREKLIQAFATINSNTRKGNRSYNEMYISNPNEVMAVFAYDMDYSRTLGNPVEFLGKTEAGAHEKGYNGVGRVSAYDRTAFLRQYALERNLPFIVFGD